MSVHFSSLFFLYMRRRATANFTTAPRATIIHATPHGYNLFSKTHTSIKHTHTHTSFYFVDIFALRHEKESYCKIWQATPPHLSCMLQNTYTIHTRKFDSRRCVDFLWPFVLIRYLFIFADHRCLLKMSKLGLLSAYLLANKNMRSRKIYHSTTEHSTAFFQAPPTAWIHLVLCCQRWDRATG